ncbi:MAG: hypothetical protein CK546_03555 [Pedosphaera sp.]|nr:DUF3341 domain-containing protein [Pedosphaera sp.]PHX95236.1 MAG: hypothetical protein CK546_03555 [Pedosphaera sp.]
MNAYGLMAVFETPADAMHAAEQVRDAGYSKWDVHTPFPVHGLDAAMGISNSKVGWFTFIGGATGYTTGMIMIWWMNAFDYKIVIGGKPMFSPFYAFPVSYELTILFASFGSLIGMALLNRLPRLHHPLLKNRRFCQGASHDKFILVIETADPKFNAEETRKLLASAGSKHIEMVED